MEVATKAPARSFQDLRVWQAAYELAIMTYKLCETFPKHEQYALTSQMCRAAVSVCSNIAEGFGRRSTKEKDQFYSMANGSLTELENQLLIARGVNYVSDHSYEPMIRQCDAVHRMLITLQKVNSQRSRNQVGAFHNLKSEFYNPRKEF